MQQKQVGQIGKNLTFSSLIVGLANFGIAFFVSPWLWIWGYFLFIAGFVVYQGLAGAVFLSNNTLRLSFFLALLVALHQCWYFFGKRYPELKIIFLVAGFLQIVAMGLVFWNFIRI